MTGNFALLYKRTSQVSQHSKQANTGTRPYLAMLKLQIGTSSYLPMTKQRSPAPTPTWPIEIVTIGTNVYLANRNSDHWHWVLPGHVEVAMHERFVEADDGCPPHIAVMKESVEEPIHLEYTSAL